MIRQKDGSNSHNLFGIKATNWSGEPAMARTTEYLNGRAVKQVEGSVPMPPSSRASMTSSAFFRTAIVTSRPSMPVAIPERFVRELQKAGYATDPQYARKVSQIARRMEAYQTVASTGSSSAIRTRVKSWRA